MTKVFRDKTFRSRYDQNSGKTFADLEFVRCHFVSSRISITRDPRRRSTVRNVSLIDCEVHGCALEAAVVEDVLVDGLKTHGDFAAWGAVFRHVTLRGKIGELMISPWVATMMAKPEEQRAFDIANAAYYAAVDWALDIREARFVDADLRGVPGHLVKRDPETQFLLTRRQVVEGRWKQVDLSGTHWATTIQFFAKSDRDSEVLVAPKANPRFRQLLAGLWALRDAGVVE